MCEVKEQGNRGEKTTLQSLENLRNTVTAREAILQFWVVLSSLLLEMTVAVLEYPHQRAHGYSK
jgi:hypothetical protein